jgi:hypothetical protein
MKDLLQPLVNSEVRRLQKFEGITAVMAGHQVLDPQGTPCNLGAFPRVTKEIGRRIQQEVGTSRMKLFTLIDDKRWVADPNVRLEFWSNQISNPKMAIGVGNELLKSYSLGQKKEVNELRGLWSEQALMSNFNMRLQREKGYKAAINKMMLGISALRTTNIIQEQCMLQDGCAINGCSREVIEMLGELARRRIQNVILFIPNSCQLAVSDACDIATSDKGTFLGGASMNIHAIFLNSGLGRSGGKIPMTEEDVLAMKASEIFTA